MKKIDFIKVVGSGNDFVIIDHRRNVSPIANHRLPDFVRNVCRRKKAVGADGVLVLENSKVADVRMRVLNPDGGEVEMCGNGARCVALYIKNQPRTTKGSGLSRTLRGSGQKSKVTIETKAGVREAEVINGNKVRLKMSDPRDLKLDFDLVVDGVNYKANYIDTGVPHIVLFVEDVKPVDVMKLGSNIRGHRQFQPQGANVNFTQQVDARSIRVRTYERGVENETLACGTGAVASAIITACSLQPAAPKYKINVLTQSGEALEVSFDKEDNKISNVCLEGNAEIVYRGRFNYV